MANSRRLNFYSMKLLTLLINGFLALAILFNDRFDELQTVNKVILYGTSMDHAAEKGVKSEVYIYDKSTLIKKEVTDPRGIFRFELPRAATRLVFRSEGFYSNEIPVHFVTNEVRGEFAIKIPLIRTRNPCSIKVVATKGKGENVVFRIKDLMTGADLKARICVTEGTKQACAESTDTRYPFEAKPGMRLRMTISAEGYHPVTDDFCLGADREFTIGLMHVTTAICLSIESARKEKSFVNFKRRNSGGENFNWATGEQVSGVDDIYVEPGVYDLTLNFIKDGSTGSTENKGSYTIHAGLNFLTIKNLYVSNETADNVNAGAPAGTKPEILSSAGSFDSTSIFFLQSDYILPATSKLRLDSVLSYLKSNTNLKVELTGHTENIGNRDLNLTLSEYRTKAVAHYLKNRGIAESRILMNWVGPDFVRKPGNSYRGSNQRVELRIKQKL